jgi:hypothetical protein
MSAVDQALVIGVDTYLSEDFEQLPPCRKDARDLASLLSDLDYEVIGNGPFIGSELHDEYGWVKIRDAISSGMRNLIRNYCSTFRVTDYMVTMRFF